MRLLLFYFKEILKSPILYFVLLISVLVVFVQGNWLVKEIPNNQDKYEQKVGFQNYEQFQKTDKQVFIQERTGTQKIPVYRDHMTYKNRINMTILLSKEKLEESEIELFFNRLSEKKQISDLKFLDTSELSQMGKNDFQAYRQSLYLPFGLGYTFFTQTYSTKNFNYSVNLPYQEISEMVLKEKEKISAPIARYLVRVVTIFLSIGVAILTAWFIYRDLGSNRVRAFRMANSRIFLQLMSRLVSLIFPIFLFGFLSTFLLFLLLLKQIGIDFYIYDYLIYYGLSVGVSVIVASIVAAILTSTSKNLIFGVLASFIYVAANATTSNMSEVPPFGLKWYKFIPGVTDMLWNHDVFYPYLQHQIFYLVFSMLLLLILLFIWKREIYFGKVMINR
ncbi:hypothetical protein RV11_GL000958 [Enterococcus phoeniculicola]|uniref:Uncharacterized protein n=1 Tax=Enterococcus phoeniculicola ATCC BAA-412 TaxID=1158610 RepID=R3TKK2_9ENTE|nr:hypothetical protein [Enterococcus phoeniculicola]EOL41583.1 hypothetical protein UC3_03146 [Enterococcus phoeniculicola ATCC BAA-412]EOT78923.1 hypothetical protein I589_00430 [Enterococcus phoeniculicola ATCC BAA-412]OJG70711.1 hypothetical protein RV11_GL000958 [Enterococcus phoeniculicola]